MLNVFTVVNVLLIMCIFFNARMPNKKEWIILITAYVILNILNSLFIKNENIQMIVTFVYLAVISSYLSKGKRLAAAIKSVSAVLIDIELCVVPELIESLIGSDKYTFRVDESDFTIFTFFEDVLLFPFLLLALKKLKKHGGSLNLTVAETIILTLFCIFVPVMKTGFELFDEKFNRYTFTLGWIVFILILNIAVFYGIIHRSRARYYKSLGEDYKDSFQKEADYLQDYKKERKSADRFNHDMKNHMLIIQGFLESSEYDKASEYFRKLNDERELGAKPILTGNAVLDMLLQMKQSYLTDNDIELKCGGGLEFLSFMSDIDICVIFSNLLDNAIEANVKCEGKRFIEIQSVSNGTMLMISISNRMNGKISIENGRLISDKISGIHGLGIDNVARIIEKYSGTYKIETDKDIFSFQMILTIQ